MPDQTVRVAISRARRVLRVNSCVDAMLLGAATGSLAAVLHLPAITAILAAVASFSVAAVFAWRRWTNSRVAQWIESRYPGFQNILVTAQEALSGRVIHPVVSRELLAQAAERLQGVELVQPRRLLARVVLAGAAVAAAGLLIAQPPRRDAPTVFRGDSADAGGPAERDRPLLRVTVIPPAYTQRPESTLDNPVQIQALEGSLIRLRVPGAHAPVQLVEPGREPQTFETTAEGALLDVAASTSRVFLIRNADQDRLLQLQVEHDERPVVTIERPGRDLLFGAPTGSVSLLITARDDLNVASVTLRYTHIAGSGETFTFEEGELPLRVSPDGMAVAREATGTLLLDQLKLQDGDTLVYRALARDDRPGADPVASESFLVEIGKRGEASSTGFSLPEDRDRQGLSQQMLIMKTERLHAQRGKLSADAVLEQSRLLAVEQRMVRAEFVFMTGGEVVDEVEEAEHSHELAAGRFENAGQVELLNAIREMSRAEARLNAADTGQALVFERAALGALERAFDRRRYFLRTLPERARIDPSRRLLGDTSSASPTLASRPAVPVDPVAQGIRDTIFALGVAIQTRTGLDAALAARTMSLDPQSSTMQQLAVRLSSDASLDEKAMAAVQAQTHLALLLRTRLAPAQAGRLRRDSLSGFLPSGAPQ